MCAVNWKAYLGKPYEFGARGPDAYDCWGLVAAIYRDCGVELPELASVDDPPSRHTQADLAVPWFERLARPAPLCIVAFHLHPRYITHAGVVTEDVTRFCHITRGCNVSVERLDSPLWAKRIAGFYAWGKL